MVGLALQYRKITDAPVTKTQHKRKKVFRDIPRVRGSRTTSIQYSK